jgi:hypothetical protein
MLPVHVDGPVMFGSATVAGLAGTSPGTVTYGLRSVAYPATTTSDWYVIEAAGDADGNGVFCTVIGSSFTNDLFMDQDGE